MTKPKSEYSIQTVSNALNLLEAFYDDYELGVSELSRRLDLHKNNVFRLLATLEHGGYVEQSARTERYRLGTRCLELGQAFARGHTLVRRARPILEKLAAGVHESAHLGVLRGLDVVHLDGEQPSRLVLSGSRVGDRLPAHCTALGKVLLAGSEDATRKALDVATGEGLAALTPSTIVDSHKLVEHVSSVSVKGFAVDVEECETGLTCAAAPVHDASGRVLAAISISGPSFRLPEDVLLRDVVPRVMAASDKLSQELGHTPSGSFG